MADTPTTLGGDALQPIASTWRELAVDAYTDAASMGFDPWDPATIYWRGVRDARALSSNVPTAEVTAYVRRLAGLDG